MESGSYADTWITTNPITTTSITSDYEHYSLGKIILISIIYILVCFCCIISIFNLCNNACERFMCECKINHNSHTKRRKKIKKTQISPIVDLDNISIHTLVNCAICLDEITDSQISKKKVIQFKNCKHLLHKKCFLEYYRFQTNNSQTLTCPLCRDIILV